ncbi:hypothetical protein [Streptacidiphilus jiangxiensis]|uniref:Uncharacterized protein n=1 Tax=Streptacidiphilus jiangxiensis TaxID=235985 RepID=A0A1H8ADR8_STRJI|nr:hypothetical protein [Streptacidiphilus jiangxiensis]SEM68074.1 hypothetical protein SAMN05414137_14318 [Streptacidiphilus jiangxiensis]
MSESYVDHRVLPALRNSGAVSTEVTTAWVDGVRRVTGLRWEVLPLTAAQAQSSAPLVLEKRELAVLLALCERLFGPGWAPVGKPETPPGLLAERCGRGAAAERLALLRLVLAARPDGRVRLVAGAVTAGFDRADATVARLIGRPLTEAARVVDGLIRQGLLEVPGRGVPGARLRVLVPAVAAAHGRSQSGLEVVADHFPPGVDEAVEPAGARSEDRGSVCTQCSGSSEDEGLQEPGEGWIQVGFFDVVDGVLGAGDGALRDQDAPETPSAEENHAFDLGEQASKELGSGVVDGALLHAHHTSQVVALGGSGAGESCFSGEAALGNPPLPERVSGREDRPEFGALEADGQVGGCGGPLRGEQHQDLVNERQEQKAPVGGARVLLRWSLPRGLERVLAPVQWEWARIGHAGGRRRVRAAVRAELVRLAGLVGAELAPAVLAERLERRLAAQLGQPVRDPIGWLLVRGLPQRAECYAQVCDDRVRMDTGLVCPSCELLVEDRRALRHQVARSVTEQLPGLAPEEFRAEVERRLSREVARLAAEDAVRREHARVERSRREKAWARQRDEQAAAQAELAARPCAKCGVPEAGGLCLICSETQTTRQTLESAAEFAAVAAGLVEIPAARGDLLGVCRARLEAEAEQAGERWRGQGLPEAAVVWQLRELAEQLVARERALALEGLLRGPQARSEADRVAGIERARRRGEPEVLAAADEAARRCAQALLAQRLDQVRAEVLAPVRPPVGGWRERMAQYAARPLEGESLPALVRPARVREAVSAA